MKVIKATIWVKESAYDRIQDDPDVYDMDWEDIQDV